MILVNDKVPVWSEVETILKENYQQVKTDYSEFKVYKLNNKINILCILKILGFLTQDIDFSF